MLPRADHGKGARKGNLCSTDSRLPCQAGGIKIARIRLSNGYALAAIRKTTIQRPAWLSGHERCGRNGTVAGQAGDFPCGRARTVRPRPPSGGPAVTGGHILDNLCTYKRFALPRRKKCAFLDVACNLLLSDCVFLSGGSRNLNYSGHRASAQSCEKLTLFRRRRSTCLRSTLNQCQGTRRWQGFGRGCWRSA